MALQIHSLVMFISSLFGKYLESHSDTVVPHHISPPSRIKKREKHLCTSEALSESDTIQRLQMLWDGVQIDAEGHLSSQVKCYSTETLISSSLLWSYLENHCE